MPENKIQEEYGNLQMIINLLYTHLHHIYIVKLPTVRLENSPVTAVANRVK